MATHSDSKDSFYLGQKIMIVDGPFAGMEGIIYLIDRRVGIARVKINFFTRPTPVELQFSQMKPIRED